MAKAFKRVMKAVYNDLKALGISYARATLRGTTGGRKQCQVSKPIPVVVTSGRTALPTPSTLNNLALTIRRCGIGADIRNFVCVQTNKWNLPMLVNTNISWSAGLQIGRDQSNKRQLQCRCYCYN